ncbi:hypothetical protein ACF05T_34325 [Streptomyces lateritius]|uniref:Uncharacterized protein n=1 Tax=Streptomyces lateritius TaxID=67313 RepID=A0ABW6YMQ2_9ACTN
MSTTRRPLGTGPTMSTRTTTTSLRLLPVERVELVEHDDQEHEHEHQERADANGRRRLGSGPRTA